MNELLDETVIEACMYVIASMFFCGRDAMKDANFAKFVGDLQRHYPDEFEAVMEVLESKEYLNE